MISDIEISHDCILLNLTSIAKIQPKLSIAEQNVLIKIMVASYKEGYSSAKQEEFEDEGS
jgi:regulator of RNase E activity RraB